ncbi:MAG: HAD family phosphatase, partial [Anaerolineales bacterium]|nr:HAD family phosphatase [Anaerolineales bacterium]
ATSNQQPTTNNQLPITTVIFDMDGLMVDTEPLARRAWDAVLAEHGYAMDDAVYANMVGRRSDESGQMVLDAYPLPLSRDALIAQKTKHFRVMLAHGAPVMPGLHELVAELEQRSIPWGVATSSPRTHAAIILEQLGLTAVCQAIAAGDEVAQGKPAPDIYQLAAQRMGVSAAQCVALEDSAPGCRAAIAAGMRGVAVPNGHTTPADFTFAHFVMPSLREVAARLDELLAADS